MIAKRNDPRNLVSQSIEAFIQLVTLRFSHAINGPGSGSKCNLN